MGGWRFAGFSDAWVCDFSWFCVSLFVAFMVALLPVGALLIVLVPLRIVC